MKCALKTGLLALALIGVVVGGVWQRARLKRLAAENLQLTEQTAQLKSLQHENERLRKIEVDRAELERLRGLQSEVARLRAQVSSAHVAAATVPAPKSPGKDSQGDDGAASTKAAEPAEKDGNRFAGNVSQVMKGFLEQQLMGQLSRMKTRLNLSPEQEEAIRQIMMNQIEQSAEMSQRMLSGKMTKQEMIDSAKGMKNPEDQIRALLSPEQQTAYKDFKTEDNAANARLVANAEMLQMQNVLGLSQEQQDRVFSALYEHTQKQLDGQAADPALPGSDPTAMMERQIAAKVKSLEGILTPAQLQSYRQLQESQLKLMKSMVPENK